jgi:hypothetical protein
MYTNILRKSSVNIYFNIRLVACVNVSTYLLINYGWEYFDYQGKYLIINLKFGTT